MNLKYIQANNLPKLAWCALLRKNSNRVDVYHGSQVETQPDFFAEGAWNGAFSAHDFLNATILSGTGAVCEPDQLHICTSTDKLSPVFSIRQADTVFISNSPLFALSAAGETPDPAYPFYAYDLLRIWRQGLNCPDGTFRTASGTPLHIHICTVMTIRCDLSISFETHPLEKAPETYEQYKQLLADGVQDVLRNGADPQRRNPYSPLTTISKGYDSCAVSVLAAHAGCTEAISLTDSRLDIPSIDSGAEIAQTLGMQCEERDRWAYQKMSSPIDAEFAMFTLAVNAPIAAFENILKQKILITGHFGAIWSKAKPIKIKDLCETSAKKVAGMGQIEFRLRTGYLTFTPTYIGARHNNNIHAIANSDAMRTWSVGGHYDKPIARRIIEEAGVPRNQFAPKKHAGGHAGCNRPNHFSPQALHNYELFIRKNHASVPGRKRMAWFLTAQLQQSLWSLPDSLIPASIRQHRSARFLYPSALRIPWKFMFVFQWVFDALKDRYQLHETRDSS